MDTITDASRDAVRRTRRVPPHDLLILGFEIALVAIAVAVGAWLNARGVPIHASAAPLFARWLPHVGPGTAVATTVAALVTWHGFAFASRARWGVLLLAGYITTLAWTFGLALVDGWQRGIASRLATPPEYLHDVPRVTSIRDMLAGFTDHIVGHNAWTTHVAGHPPGAFLVFVSLDRLGLRGGGAAGVACIVIGALAPICVAVTIRAVGSDRPARAALPFLVLFPGAVWVGSSADGLFAGVAAAALALVAIGGVLRASIGGMLLGYAIYLSYGLALVVLPAAVVLVARRRRGVTVATGVGILALVVAFTKAGFWWPTGYQLVRARYYAGYGGERPYSYWVWANVACLIVCAGPVIGPALLRAGREARVALHVKARRRLRPLAVQSAPAPMSPQRRGPQSVILPALLALASLAAIGIADLSGLSKAETERIWLPYAIWLLAATAYLPIRGRRGWLALQAITALAVNHLLLTHW